MDAKKIVTVVNPQIWGLTGHRFVQSHLRYWKHFAELEVWCLGFDGKLPAVKGVTFRELESTPTFMTLEGVEKAAASVPVALAMALRPDLKWLGYVDASIEWMTKPKSEHLAEMFDSTADLVVLQDGAGRQNSGQVVLFNVARPGAASLLSDYWGLYNSQEAWHYKDSGSFAVLDRLIVLHAAHGLRVKNLSASAKGGDLFHQSVLCELGVAYAPPEFRMVPNPGVGQLSRYETLSDIVGQVVGLTARAHFVEVGTWNGGRAVQMAQAAFMTGIRNVKYVGFDVFEEPLDQEHEVNVKGAWTVKRVTQRLAYFAKVCGRLGFKFEYKLIKGNTLKTLPKSRAHIRDATFAWLDGGHSEETVASDYAALKHVPYILFDDVFPMPEAGVPRGPHTVWAKATGQKQLVQSGDVGVAARQPICLGLVVREGRPRPQLWSRIQVRPIDSVPKLEQFEYITANSAAIKEWLEPAQAHEKWALMVSAGPTLKDFLPEIKQRQEAGALVFAVKHALPLLKAGGIRPDYVVILDPRPVNEISTHGVLRTDLFKDVEPEDVFLLATMTHPSVREVLEAAGARVVGWHAQTQITLAANLPAFQQGMVVGGGTCCATRMPMLAFSMGFRRMAFYGYDFFYPAGTPQEGVKQKLLPISVGRKSPRQFLSTGELIAAMQDLEQWNKWILHQQLTVEWRGDGIGAIIWRDTAPNYRTPPEFTNLGRRAPEAPQR